MDRCIKIVRLYQRLKEAYGPKQDWWPGDSPVEVAIGAILTQNTNWNNAFKALKNLREVRLSSDLSKLARTEPEKISELIKPAGFYRQKSQYLIGFAQAIVGSVGDIIGLKTMENPRSFLLNLKGIGRETADSILLYALNLPHFVIDTYTRRILTRTGILPNADRLKYEKLKEIFERCIEPNPALYQEFHALLVEHAKAICRKRNPMCENCPIRDICAWQSPR